MMIYFLLPVPRPDKRGGKNNVCKRPVHKVNLATLAKIGEFAKTQRLSTDDENTFLTTIDAENIFMWLQ